MKLSCTAISLSKTFREGGMNIETYIAFCAEQGLNGVDVLARKYSWQWRDADSELKNIPGWAKAAGIKIAAFAAGNKFTVEDETEFNANVEMVREALRDAGAIGAPLLRIFGGAHPCCGGKLPHARALEKVLHGIELCLPEAQKQRVALALENHGCLPGHSYEIAAIIHKFNSPWLKCTFDCANFLANNMDEKENPLTAYDRLKGQIAHVHFKDFDIDPAAPGRKVQACPAGQGIVPLRQLSALMREDGYAGYCSLEYEAGSRMPELDGVPLSIKYMREIVAVHKALAL